MEEDEDCWNKIYRRTAVGKIEKPKSPGKTSLKLLGNTGRSFSGMVRKERGPSVKIVDPDGTVKNAIVNETNRTGGTKSSCTA